MKSIYIIPRDKKEFSVALTCVIEFSRERKRLSLSEDENIGFSFLMKEKSDETQTKAMPTKLSSGKK